MDVPVELGLHLQGARNLGIRRVELLEVRMTISPTPDPLWETTTARGFAKR